MCELTRTESEYAYIVIVAHIYIIIDDMEQLNCLTLRRLTFIPDHVHPVYLD